MTEPAKEVIPGMPEYDVVAQRAKCPICASEVGQPCTFLGTSTIRVFSHSARYAAGAASDRARIERAMDETA